MQRLPASNPPPFTSRIINEKPGFILTAGQDSRAGLNLIFSIIFTLNFIAYKVK
jgi:hypothetical protein